MPSRFTVFSDPVHGFISIPRNVQLNLIGTPEVQRLRRIRQLGVGYMVFPGAEHSRFGHALGATALMHDTLASLAEKGIPISADEHAAGCIAALAHDVGHGPFSHTLENELMEGFHHEAMSRVLLSHFGQRFGSLLDQALAIFDGTYDRPFFHELVSSQLDMDRLDYLRRDSYYTGVVEGRVGVERIIKTLTVAPRDGREHLAIEAKGVYAVENFLVSRRLMYWQVYLHKTVLAGDQVLRSLVRRAREHFAEGRSSAVEGVAPAFGYFLSRAVPADSIAHPDVRQHYCDLDDADILYSIKRWTRSNDPILADLANRFLHRRFFRVAFVERRPDVTALDEWRGRVADFLVESGLSNRAHATTDAGYYLSTHAARHTAYDRAHEPISVLGRDGTLTELTASGESPTIGVLAHGEVRPFVSHPKEVQLPIP